MNDEGDIEYIIGEQVMEHALQRLRSGVDGLGSTADPDAMAERLGDSITPAGLGGSEALRLFTDVVQPACLQVDHPRFLSFVPAAPTNMALLGDVLLSASRIYGGSWMEGAGAVQAENDVIRWIVDICGLPGGSGGVFVPGGTNGNTSALIAARHRWRAGGAHERSGGIIISSESVHASIPQAARAMDAELLLVPGDELGRLDRASLQAVLRALGDDASEVFAVVATAGTTNAGVLDDLEAAADACEELGAWLHVDGAYGLAAACSPRYRHLFRGVERADSLIVDPHKWLFGPFDSCALVYREPAVAKEAHTQRADYLDVLQDSDESGRPHWNPSDYAHHLSRRPRGLPMWFSLVALGTDAYAEAIDTTMALAKQAAALAREVPHLELLVEPELTTVVFARLGWTSSDYAEWSRRAMEAGTGVLLPTTWNGDPAFRMCIVNPQTEIGDIKSIVEALL